MNPRTVCFCQPICCMISASVAPSLRCSMATTFAVLLPSRGPTLSSALAAFLALGDFLAGVGFPVAVPSAGAPWGSAPPTLATGSTASLASGAAIASCFAGGVEGDVVVGVDGERFHVSALFPTAYRDDHIHHSGRGNRQANNAGNRSARWNEAGAPLIGEVGNSPRWA